MRILIAGVGNLVMSDDGVGVHAIGRLRDLEGENTQVVEIGTAVLRSTSYLEWADRVLAIDAMQAGGVPGTIYRAEKDDLNARSELGSLHEVDLFSVLHLLPEVLRPAITVIGIEPEVIEFGLELSAGVKASLPEVEKQVRLIIAEWTSPTRLT